jgi:hypothetical protein
MFSILGCRRTPWPQSASELYRPSDRHLSAKLVPTFTDRGCQVVSVTGPHGRILDFIDWSRNFSFHVAITVLLPPLRAFFYKRVLSILTYWQPFYLLDTFRLTRLVSLFSPVNTCHFCTLYDGLHLIEVSNDVTFWMRSSNHL